MARKQTDDKLQTFSITAPNAKAVALVGEFTHWQEKPILLKKESGDTWRATVKLSPGTHLYRFIVDGQWCDDPQCASRVPNPYGGQDSVRQVV